MVSKNINSEKCPLCKATVCGIAHEEKNTCYIQQATAVIIRHI